jgi:hypothetical protein
MPWFGAKSRIAPQVWERFGDVPNYVEPFFGSGAVLLARPDDHKGGIETVNDKDGFVSNFWRATKMAPDEVAHWADWPVNENDLHARHVWLVGQRESITSRLEGDPDFYDAKVAGWWLWGISSWIGSGWCAGVGPWHSVDGELVDTRDDGMVTWRQLPHLGNAGRGINRQLPHLGDAGRGINRKQDDNTCDDWSAHLRHMMRELADRLRAVRVCSGDWTRVLGPSPTEKLGLTAVFLDPPYSHDERAGALYAVEMPLADEVREWAIAHGDNPSYRIALCGYEGEHEMPEGWETLRWKAKGGYGSQSEDGRGRENAERECVWFSPHGLKPERAEQLSMF